MNALTKLQPIVATAASPVNLPVPPDGGGVRRSTKNSRHFVRVSIPGKVRIGQTLYGLVNISMGGFAVDMPAADVPLGAIADCELFVVGQGWPSRHCPWRHCGLDRRQYRPRRVPHRRYRQ